MAQMCMLITAKIICVGGMKRCWWIRCAHHSPKLVAFSCEKPKVQRATTNCSNTSNRWENRMFYLFGNVKLL